MNNYYFTFGVGQTLLAGYYLKISAPTEDAAREIMFENFGSKWCTSYPEAIWKQQKIAETWNYKELKL